jgi:hypothetical protein
MELDEPSDFADDQRPVLRSRGRCFVYVLPCAYDDILKLGMSRDPLARMQTLHHRYFEFFDLERALLIETETVRDARRLELALGGGIEAHNAPAPLVVRGEAGGHTEWYRGAFERLQDAATDLARTGYAVHKPARSWLRSRLIASSDHLYPWSNETLLAIESNAIPTEVARHLRRLLLDSLDAFSAFDIDVEPLLPEAVWRWLAVQRNVP